MKKQRRATRRETDRHPGIAEGALSPSSRNPAKRDIRDPEGGYSWIPDNAFGISGACPGRRSGDDGLLATPLSED